MALKRIRQRRGTALEWTAANPVLGLGEVGWEYDSGKRKTGDGVTAWNGLAYDAGGGEGSGTVVDIVGTAPIVVGGTPENPVISIILATASAAGAMSGADKNKLDNIAAGATANSSDAQLRDRATHTGTQTASTISDFTSAASAAAPVQSVAGKTGALSLVKADVGLANVDNTSDLAKPISSATQSALAGKAGSGLATASGLTANGSRLLGRYSLSTGALEEISVGAGLELTAGVLSATGGGGGGSVSSVGLSAPVEFSVSGSPVTASGTLALAWGAQAVNSVLAGPSAGGSATPGFRVLVPADIPVLQSSKISDFSVAAATAAPVQSVAGKTGSVSLVKGDVGLTNVDNTSDLNKPISTATQAALANKAAAGPAISSGLSMATDRLLGRYSASAGAIEEVAIGQYLGMGPGGLAVDFGAQVAGRVFAGPPSGGAAQPTFRAIAESDIPVMGAAKIGDFASAASAAAPVQSVAGRTGAVSLVKADVGLADVDNTSDLAKPISSATQAALSNKAAIGAIGASGLVMNENFVLGRTSSGAGSVQELGLRGLIAFDDINGDLVVEALSAGFGAPVSPTVGQSWVDYATGVTYTWMEDSDGSLQWVELGSPGYGRRGPLGPMGIVIANPSNNEKVVMFSAPGAENVLISAIEAVLVGSASPSVTFSVRYGADISQGGTEVVSGGMMVTSTTTGQGWYLDFGDLTNAVVPAGNWVWVTTSAASGTVDSMHVTIKPS